MGEFGPLLRLRAWVRRRISARRRPPSDPDLPVYSSTSLRFEDAGTEQGFLRSASTRLVSNVFWVAVVILLLKGANFTTKLNSGQWDREDYPDDTVYQIEMICSAFDALAVLGSLLVALIMMAQRLTSCASAAAIEKGVAFLLVFVMMWGVAMDRGYMARFHGVSDPGERLDRKLTDTFILLHFSLVVTFSHMYLPIRWCLLWPLELVAVLTYPAMIVIFGSNESHPQVNLLGECGIVIFAALGKRTIERYERQAFSILISERTARAKVEHRLHKMTAGSEQPQCGTPPASNSIKSASNEVASTGTSGIFNHGVEADDFKACLNKLMDVGRQEHWLIEVEQLKLAPHAALGEGSFGVVVAGVFQSTPVAVKVPQSDPEKGQVTGHLNELRVLRRVRHPNIVIFFGALIDTSQHEIALILELVQGQSLQDFAPSPAASDVNRYQVLSGISRALHYLHGQIPAIVHGDLKPSNVMVETIGSAAVVRAKLLDFGLSRVRSHHAKPLGGTLSWMAPEVIASKDRKYLTPNPAADVFSLGRMMHFTITGKSALAGVSHYALMRMARKRQLPKLDWTGNSTLTSLCSKLVSRCTLVNPAERWGMADVCAELAQWPNSQSHAHLDGEHGCEPNSSSSSASCRISLPQETSGLDRLVPWDTYIRRARKRDAPSGSQARSTSAGGPGAQVVGNQHALPAVMEDEDKWTTVVQPTTPAHPFKSTPYETQVKMLKPVMERWVCSQPGEVACCAYHAAVAKMAHAAHGLYNTKCKTHWGFLVASDEASQCPKCFAVSRENHMRKGKCDVCGHDWAQPACSASPENDNAAAGASITMSL
mmetsp:Transcript_113391/g.293575  ORF Transcript_113391/g.293575 Transcript_113391/m.293575 type:complete len:826 (+) Transcript_113391:56-2533(+)